MIGAFVDRGVDLQLVVGVAAVSVKDLDLPFRFFEFQPVEEILLFEGHFLSQLADGDLFVAFKGDFFDVGFFFYLEGKAPGSGIHRHFDVFKEVEAEDVLYVRTDSLFGVIFACF